MRILTVLGLSLAIASLGLAQGRQQVLLDGSWRFCRGEPSGSALKEEGLHIDNWQWIEDPKGGADAAAMAGLTADTSKWQYSKSGDDTFKGKVAFEWFRTNLPAVQGTSPILHFETVDDNATVYLNGVMLVRHEGWDDPFDVNLGPAWKDKGPNTLAVLVENTAGPGGITGPVYFETSGDHTAASGPATAAYDDRSWRSVHLPHDYLVEGKFAESEDNSHASLPKPTAWYRKTITIPASAQGQSVWIDFEGIYRDSRVWLNGHYLGRHQSGYTSSQYNLAQYANYGGTNVLAVHVNPAHNEGWWYEGAGIYRHVWLNIANPVHIEPSGVFSSATLPEPQGGQNPSSAQVTIQTRVMNQSTSTARVEVDSELFDGNQHVVVRGKETVEIPPGHVATAEATTTLPHPHLWSLGDPHLYRVKTQVRMGGKIVDAQGTNFGIRTIRFDPDRGFFLNGLPVKIRGVCNHQDFAGIGIAVPDQFEFWRVEKMKAMGANAWRMSHNPPTPSLLDACDRLGMLVMDENRHLGATPQNLEEVASMVKRDRNHPSVIIWSMCNEQPEAGSAEGGKTFQAMKDEVLKFDTTRPISCAMNQGWFGKGFTDVEDLMGVNYSYDVYDRFHTLHPKMPLFGSETASTLTTRGEYADDKAKGYASSYNMTDDAWRPAAERPFVAGTFVWTGFDYKGEPAPFGWPAINSNFGILDMCGFPKDNYYYYRAWWQDDPVVHIVPHWNWQSKEGQPIKVIAFSNGANVELLLNGASLGTKPVPKFGHLEWDVPYQPGTLTARAFGFDGKVIATDKVETTGPPAAIKLRTDRVKIYANAEDVTVVEVSVVDAQGRVVPTANNLVNFNVSGVGYIGGVGNGDPSDHDPDKARFRHAFHGLCAVMVASGEKLGDIHVSASAEGLKGADLNLEAIMP